MVRLVASGEEVTSGQMPFTPRAKKVLERALREALSLGHNYIGTEHILLGLVRENEGVAARILLTSTPTPRRSATRSSACSPDLAGSKGVPNRRTLDLRKGAAAPGAYEVIKPRLPRALVAWEQPPSAVRQEPIARCCFLEHE